MSKLFDDNSAIVLSKSARHCCICRQFLPLYIQVHHIKQKSNGGTDELDNLIPVCIQCHSAIHTKTHMTKSFTSVELKKSRDFVYEMVATGKLPATNISPIAELEQIISTLKEQSLKSRATKDLDKESMEILVKAYYYNTSILVKNNDGYSYVKIGSEMIFLHIDKYQKYPTPIIDLLEKEFLSEKDNCLHISSKGESFLQGLIRDIPTYTQMKVKCLNCGLHFIICTWYKDRHTNKTIYCPECGLHNGANLVWMQEKPGFIFEDVPGQAMLCNLE